MIRIARPQDIELAAKIALLQIQQEADRLRAKPSCSKCGKRYSSYRQKTKSVLCGECYYKIPGVIPETFTGPLEPAGMPQRWDEDDDNGGYRSIAVRAMEDGICE